MEKTIIEFEDLKEGMIVIDSDGDEGTIINIENLNNVDIKYGELGFGILCFDKKCQDYTPTYIKN